MNPNTSSLAVVIPCRNEKQFIAKCLDSIIACGYAKDLLHVYVCDGLSDDGTIEIIIDYAAKHKFIHHLENLKRTTPFALNLGIKTSNTDYVTILGAHAEVSESYFSACVADFQKDEKIGCTGGLLENVYSDEVSEAIGLAQSSSFGVGNANFRTGAKSGFVDTVAFGTYKREVFEKIGYFDEELARNQDDEFNYRLLKNGFLIHLNTDVSALYYVRGNFQKLYAQYWQYGYWKVFVNVKHKVVTTVRQLVPALFVLFIALGAIASILFPVLSTFYLLGWGVYVLGSLISALQRSKKPKQILQIMVAVYVIHLSYGSGYLKGIWNFILLRKKPSESSQKLSR